MTRKGMSDLMWFPRQQERLAAEWPWLVDLICCGRDEGIEACSTWEMADQFRESYCNAEGHDRAGIVRRSPLYEYGDLVDKMAGHYARCGCRSDDALGGRGDA